MSDKIRRNWQSKRHSLKKKTFIMRQKKISKNDLIDFNISENTFSETFSETIPSTSYQSYACESTINVMDSKNDCEISTSSLNTSSLNCSELFVDSYTTDVEQFNKNANSLNEDIYEADVINNDAMTLQSLSDTFAETPANTCMLTNIASENIRQDNVDEDIENIVLHEDGNIDVDRLLSAEISGRSIVDFGHIFAELQRLSTHWLGECHFTDLVIMKTKRHGLKIQYFVQCRMCNFRDSFWSEPTTDNILDVNRGAVCGTILTGTGHKQLEELLAAMDVPCMSNKTYINYYNEMSEAFSAAAEEELRVAAEEEKHLAIKRGDIINGIPHIPVIVDGSWMKRSYRSGSYDSPSGAAIITGYYSKKVLFVGIKNKYCIVCARAVKKKVEPREHVF